MYLQLEEPAWFVFRKTTQRYKAETIANEFASRYGIPIIESLTFINDIRSEINKLNIAEHPKNKITEFLYELNKHAFTSFSVHRYLLGNKLIEFVFENKYFEHFLHPLLSHFETAENSTEKTLFELFAHQEQIVFRFNGVVKGVWTKDETHLVKGLIFMFLINVMYDKTETDWLMTVHASAITNGKKTILFSAPPNHGKTTIAALLQDRGYQLISDDFVPIDRHSFKAYPFPIAMSVKQSSMHLLAALFPTLEEKPLNYISPEKSVRFLPPKVNPEINSRIFQVHGFVFIKYDSDVDFVWEKLDPVKALKLLLDQAWVTPTPGNAVLLFERIFQLSFYQLTYSNNKKALDTIAKLFENE